MPSANTDPITRAANQDYPDHYTSEDRMAVRTITAMLASAGLSQGQLARMAGCSKPTACQVLGGKCKYSPTKWLAKYRSVIDEYMGHDLALPELDAVGETDRIEAPFVTTSVYRAVAAACYRARRYGGFGVVAAFVGTGKTTAIERIAEEQEDVYVVHGLPGMTHSILLDELVAQVACPVKSSSTKTGGTKAEKLRALIGALKGRRALIVLDEAETCSASTLEYLRRLRDLAEAGVVLCGTERLMPMVRDPRGRFGQISSRVLYWPPIIRRCSSEDIRALAEACMPDVSLDDDLLKALEKACDGSARVLCDGVLPGLRDYGLNKGHQLTPALVKKISRDLLGFTPARRQA